MSFSLINAPVQFQGIITQTLAGLLNINYIIYLDDILIFSDNKKDYIEYIKAVLYRLREAKLYINKKKCKQHTKSTKYLNFIITLKGLQVDLKHFKVVETWLKLIYIQDIRVFIGFINYYRRFIKYFSKIALLLTILIQKALNSARQESAIRRKESI